MEINKLIENLIFYAKDELGLGEEDSIYAKNSLYYLFKSAPTYELADKVELQSEILIPMVEYAIKKNIIAPEEALNFETTIMGIVTPSPNLVINRFNELQISHNSKKATEYLYELSIKSNYIRLLDIKKNIRWITRGPNGDIGITINLAKPEKDPKQIQKESVSSNERYPKCPLCLENLGFWGDGKTPARHTLRYVPITLNGEKWHLQYSPYVYYDEHCIALSDRHIPMKIDENAFARLLDFVSQFPHYFIGSNADLPIVGGSILSHDHYQGGKKVLPMFSRPLRKKYNFRRNATIGIRDWYNSVIHIAAKNKFEVLQIAERVLKKWQNFSDEEIGILSYTDQPHNTITPIASINSHDEYCLDLILRNNRTDNEHPYGIYHPTEDLHNIKKEGIGLIEAMGLFILPGRLKKEIALMIELFTNQSIDFKKLNEDEHLSKHLAMVAQIANNEGLGLDKKTARDAIFSYINSACIRILECTAVFKNNTKGMAAFDRFMKIVQDSL
ncbi:MAG: UDP-glucose--hexose-1-phosphate uridylyltransferase [Bacillota bacterium]|jgi:UDPglucose--hexose-1-phosphate uridylyltransferase|nr:UDP-glucose--hexose-1-phosphate uridylyltransferase [Bacillota bacterium]HHU43084.1 UDP-glucose--hexose-1-phosphate uridylyltransferase [Clostridiales bacterium]